MPVKLATVVSHATQDILAYHRDSNPGYGLCVLTSCGRLSARRAIACSDGSGANQGAVPALCHGDGALGTRLLVGTPFAVLGLFTGSPLDVKTQGEEGQGEGVCKSCRHVSQAVA